VEYCFTAIADGLRSQQTSSSTVYNEAVLLIRHLLAIETGSIPWPLSGLLLIYDNL
jgi:hypothetical protein